MTQVSNLQLLEIANDAGYPPAYGEELLFFRRYTARIVEAFLKQSGQYITNDASRNAALDAAVSSK